MGLSSRSTAESAFDFETRNFETRKTILVPLTRATQHPQLHSQARSSKARRTALDVQRVSGGSGFSVSCFWFFC